MGDTRATARATAPKGDPPKAASAPVQPLCPWHLRAV